VEGGDPPLLEELLEDVSLLEFTSSVPHKSDSVQAQQGFRRECLVVVLLGFQDHNEVVPMAVHVVDPGVEDHALPELRNVLPVLDR